MKHVPLLALMFLLVLIAGCDGRKESATTEQKDRVEGVSKETGQAARESRMTADQQKADYIKQGRTKLTQYDESIKKLQDKAGAKGEDQDMKNLLAKRDNAAQKLREVESGPPEKWEKQKTDLDNVFNELDQQFRFVESKHGK